MPTRILLAAILALSAALPLLAAPLAGQVPVAIEADSMEYLHKAGRILFHGQVHVTRQDMELWADRIIVQLEEAAKNATKAASGNVRTITAEGNVRLQAAQNRTGQAKRAVYDARTEKVTLEGDPVVREGDNSIRGEVIIFHLSDGTSEVRGGPKQRVEAIFLAPETLPALERKP